MSKIKKIKNDEAVKSKHFSTGNKQGHMFFESFLLPKKHQKKNSQLAPLPSFTHHHHGTITASRGDLKHLLWPGGFQNLRLFAMRFLHVSPGKNPKEKPNGWREMAVSKYFLTKDLQDGRHQVSRSSFIRLFCWLLLTESPAPLLEEFCSCMVSCKVIFLVYQYLIIRHNMILVHGIRRCNKCCRLWVRFLPRGWGHVYAPGRNNHFHSKNSEKESPSENQTLCTLKVAWATFNKTSEWHSVILLLSQGSLWWLSLSPM